MKEGEGGRGREGEGGSGLQDEVLCSNPRLHTSSAKAAARSAYSGFLYLSACTEATVAEYCFERTVSEKGTH